MKKFKEWFNKSWLKHFLGIGMAMLLLVILITIVIWFCICFIIWEFTLPNFNSVPNEVYRLFIIFYLLFTLLVTKETYNN